MSADFRVVLHEVTARGHRTSYGLASVLLPRLRIARVGSWASYADSDEKAGEVTSMTDLYAVPVERKDGRPDRRHKRCWWYDSGFLQDGPKTGPTAMSSAEAS